MCTKELILHTVKQKDHYRQILHLVNGIGRLTNPQHLPASKERRISLIQFLTLDSLNASRGALRMSELALAAGVAPTELSRIVRGLEANGWIDRSTDPADSRAKLVSLTRTGRALIKRVHRQAAEDLHGVWTDFTHDEWHRFIDFLNRFESGLRRVRGGQATAGNSSPQRKASRTRS